MDRQCAIPPLQGRANRAGASCALHATQADRGDRPVDRWSVGAIDIGVVVQNIPGGVGTTRAVADATGFRCRGTVVAGDGGIVSAGDRDGEDGRVGEAAGIAHRVVERLDQLVARIHAIHLGIGVVERVGVGPVGTDAEAAVGANKQEATIPVRAAWCT